MKSQKPTIGIITFHFADNYGALLQAFALKQYLQYNGMDVHIVRYEPFFMTGRDWWIPYLPLNGIKNCLRLGKNMWKDHRKMGLSFFVLRFHMKKFRKKYLLEKGQNKLLFPFQLKKLPYQCYILGSDQIWNPEITCGLKKVYFGSFQTKYKKRVISYAASMGSASLMPKYDQEFSQLLSYVDAISIREENALSYLKKVCQRDIVPVLDPVFLLSKESWMQIEKRPQKENYILVYSMEENPELTRCITSLSRNKALPVIKLQTSNGSTSKDYKVDSSAGPSEFLGYIHMASYVITNSFHAVALSIIFQKKFLVFPHSTRNARIDNILRIHGLENRVYHKDKPMQITEEIDWSAVKQNLETAANLSKEFLAKNIY